LQERGHGAQAYHGHATLLQKISPGKSHVRLLLLQHQLNGNSISTRHQTEANKARLASLKFWSAENQSGHYSEVNLFYRIIELGLQNLRAV
jgi:hypothetical protein